MDFSVRIVYQGVIINGGRSRNRKKKGRPVMTSLVPPSKSPSEGPKRGPVLLKRGTKEGPKI